MTFTTWFSCFLFAMITSLSPGAGSILTINHALQHGWKKTPMLIAGQEIALMIIVVTVAVGAGILLNSPTLLFSLKLFGVLWLVFTAWQTWSTPVYQQTMGVAAPIILSRTARFMRGFITTAMNAKVITCLISTMPMFLKKDYPLGPQIVIMALTMVIIDSLVMLGFAIIACRLWPNFNNANSIKRQNKISAIALLLIAVSICFI